MVEVGIATPTQVRARIDTIGNGTVRVPAPIKTDLGRTVKVDLGVLKVVDMLALVGGFRISELVTKHSGPQGNTSETLTIETTEHRATGTEAILISVNALKKKAPVVRELGIPLDPHSEPYAKPILEAWERSSGNPCNIDRTKAFLGNRMIFDGLNYKIKSRVDYERGNDGKLIRDAEGKKIIKEIVKAHPKPSSNHGLRHIRAEELRKVFQLTREERVSFFSWSTLMLGDAPVMDDYSQMEWIEWFPKLIKR